MNVFKLDKFSSGELVFKLNLVLECKISALIRLPAHPYEESGFHNMFMNTAGWHGSANY